MAQKTALVTGGTGTIGSEICRQLSDAGCRVVATCLPAEADMAREWQAEQKKAGRDIGVVPCDLADFEATREAVVQAAELAGPVDILVNVAGITRDATLRKMTAEQWREVIQSNLDSVFNATRNVIEGMLQRGFGRVISISSINGQKGQFGQANYAASKAGIHGFTMSVAQEGARKNVTANTISPGYIESPMVNAVPEDIRNQIIAQIPRNRLGQPADIARTVVFLAAEDADFITGANIPVNGGHYMS
ncbi:MAG: acetoacetyl-CoA reductase [Gammaproteobacteria bacterium]|jgi:acetoacetyl-CoA reductase